MKSGIYYFNTDPQSMYLFRVHELETGGRKQKASSQLFVSEQADSEGEQVRLEPESGTRWG